MSNAMADQLIAISCLWSRTVLSQQLFTHCCIHSFIDLYNCKTNTSRLQ